MKQKKKLLITVIMFGTVALIVLFYVGMQFLEKQLEVVNTAKVEKDSLAPENIHTKNEPKAVLTLNKERYAFYHEMETYLFIGTDESGKEDAGADDYHGNMADFLLVAVIDKTEHSYSLLQLNRDTMTDITLMQPDGTGMASARIQLCTAHWYGGSKEQSCENTVEAVSKLLGNLPIDGYYSLNMREIQELNHVVGGVTVTIEEDFSKVDSSLKKGEKITLNDSQAYTYIHDRYDVGDEKNSSRMERQKQYLKGFFEKAQKKNRENSRFSIQLYKMLEEKAVTDMTGKTVSRLAKEITKSESRGIYQIAGEETTGSALDDGLQHTEFYVDEKSLLQTMTELYHLEKYGEKE